MITVRRIGTSKKVHSHAIWSGVGYGTVDLCTRKVMTAIHNSSLRRMHIRWPIGQEREEPKQWTNAQACPAWRDGWCIVDGTLIPLYNRPRDYGDLWFDRKSNYSMNVQEIITPNLKIIDYYVSGFRGAQHDSHYFTTRLALDHQRLLAPKDRWFFDLDLADLKRRSEDSKGSGQEPHRELRNFGSGLHQNRTV